MIGLFTPLTNGEQVIGSYNSTLNYFLMIEQPLEYEILKRPH